MRWKNGPRPLHDAGFTVFDTFFDQVSATVGRHPIESGGAILGDYTSGVITSFIFDEEAETTSVSYVPSRELNKRVNVAEDNQRLQFKGILHSHPGNFDVPSGPDANSFRAGLEENPELSRYLAPIVTFSPGEARENKIELPNGGWITFYVALRNGARNVRIERTMPDVIYFGRDCRTIATLLGINEPQFSDGFNGNVSVVNAVLELTSELELILSADGTYPNNAPLALIHNREKHVTSQLNLRWSATDDPDVRLIRSISDVLSPQEDFPKSIAFGLNGIPLTSHKQLANALQLTPLLVGDSFGERTSKVEEGLFARSKGLLSDRLRNCRVLVNGAGSVGSYVAEQLVRSGIGGIVLLDPDLVDYSNLSRTNYVASDVGKLKVNALANRLLQISPSLDIELIPENLHNLSKETLSSLFATVDASICAVDDRRAQLLINHFAYHFKKPAVYVGIYKGARSGEVLFVEPPLPCFDCATSFRREITTEGERTTDYGTGQLVAEVALGIDIQAITAAAVRLGLSRLVRETDSSLATFISELGQRQYAILGIDPSVPIIDEIMADTMAQYAYRSIWFSAKRNEECIVCGTNPSEPIATIHVSVSDIQRELERQSASSNDHEVIQNLQESS